MNIAHSSLIADYKSLVSQFPKVQTNYCYREANQCAGRLTKYGAKLEQNFIIYDSLIWRSICCCFMIFLACVLRGLCLTLVFFFPLSNKILVYRKRKKKLSTQNFYNLIKAHLILWMRITTILVIFIIKNKMWCYKN